MNAEIRSSRPPLLPAGWALTRFGLWLLAVSCPILLALGLYQFIWADATRTVIFGAPVIFLGQKVPFVLATIALGGLAGEGHRQAPAHSIQASVSGSGGAWAGSVRPTAARTSAQFRRHLWRARETFQRAATSAKET